MKNILVIGGSGILGRPLIERLADQDDTSVFSVALNSVTTANSRIQQLCLDRNTSDFSQSIREITAQIGRWNCIVDLCAFDELQSKNLHEILGKHCDHWIILSTTLVYDRSHPNSQPISEMTPLAHPGKYGGYVDGKLAIERFWQSQNQASWTILRPYHIIGSGSLLGCVPLHNRDPWLLDRIRSGESLQLTEGGQGRFSYVNLVDVAAAVQAVMAIPRCFGQAYNLVHSKPISPLEYYKEIARQLGSNIKVIPVRLEKIWANKMGWEMTTLPHVYSADKLFSEVGFNPSVSLDQCISEAIANYPVPMDIDVLPVHQRMNKGSSPVPPRWLLEQSRA